MNVSTMTGVVRAWVLPLCMCVSKVEYLCGTLWLEGQDLRPCCHAVQFPVAAGASAPRRSVLCALALLRLPACVGLRAQPPSLVIQNCSYGYQCSPGFASTMCVPAHPPLTYSCVKSSDLVVCWTEAPLLSCRCFPGGRLKGRDKQSISTTMMLMSHQKDSSCSGGRQWHFRLGFRRRQGEHIQLIDDNAIAKIVHM